MRYIKNACSAFWALLTCWFADNEKLKRRKRFIEDGVPEEDKLTIPYKIFMWAYNKKLNRTPR